MLQALGRSRRLTLSTLIQGAWALLLSRYSGRSDVLFGVTVSGRPPELPGVESMVGMFINSLPLRVAVTEEAYLVPWLRELQATMVELRRFEAIPLSRIQAWSEVPAGMPLVREHRDRPEPPLRGVPARTCQPAGNRVGSVPGEDPLPARRHRRTGHGTGDQDRLRQRPIRYRPPSSGCSGIFVHVLEAMAVDPSGGSSTCL